MRAPCKVFRCRFIRVLLFATLQAQRHNVVVRCAVLGCLRLHLSFYHLFLHVVVSVMFAVPQLEKRKGKREKINKVPHRRLSANIAHSLGSVFWGCSNGQCSLTA